LLEPKPYTELTANTNSYYTSKPIFTNQTPGIPPICGGMFIAFPTKNTLSIFKELQRMVDNGGNDQWSMDVLLRERDVYVVNGVEPEGWWRVFKRVKRVVCQTFTITLSMRRNQPLVAT
jgi:hypothetical protein